MVGKEYIEKEALIEALGEEPYSWADTDAELQAMLDWKQFKAMVESISAADVAPVVRGYWIRCNRGFDYDRCSLCGYEHRYSETFNYCPNCGASMRRLENLKAGAEYADADTMMPAT